MMLFPSCSCTLVLCMRVSSPSNNGAFVCVHKYVSLSLSLSLFSLAIAYIPTIPRRYARWLTDPLFLFIKLYIYSRDCLHVASSLLLLKACAPHCLKHSMGHYALSLKVYGMVMAGTESTLQKPWKFSMHCPRQFRLTWAWMHLPRLHSLLLSLVLDSTYWLSFFCTGVLSSLLAFLLACWLTFLGCMISF